MDFLQNVRVQIKRIKNNDFQKTDRTVFTESVKSVAVVLKFKVCMTENYNNNSNIQRNHENNVVDKIRQSVLLLYSKRL